MKLIMWAAVYHKVRSGDPAPDEVLAAEVEIEDEGGVEDKSVDLGVFTGLCQDHEGGEEGERVAREGVEGFEFGDGQQYEE